MTQPENLHDLPIESLSERCTQETGRFFQHEPHDPCYCYEIFRRAIMERDHLAWESLYSVYQPQITRWVRRHPGFASSQEDESYFVNRAMEKMWQAITPERFYCFPELKYLLSYLQMCVHSVITDHLRASAQIELASQAGLHTIKERLSAQSIEAYTEARSQAVLIWQIVTDRVQEDKEKLVAYDSFVLGLKPSETLERFPAVFESTREIYRIKENIIGRLRRDAELSNLLDIHMEFHGEQRLL
jgi:DNA-directed RNA polymerase specialized sigma24 family protein